MNEWIIYTQLNAVVRKFAKKKRKKWKNESDNSIQTTATYQDRKSKSTVNFFTTVLALKAGYIYGTQALSIKIPKKKTWKKTWKWKNL